MSTNERPGQRNRIFNKPPPAYGTAVLATIAATLVRLALTPLIGPATVPFITYFPAVLVAAWFGGFRASALTILLSAAAADYFFVQPVRTFHIPAPVDQIALVVFVVVGFGIALLSHAQRRAEVAERVQRRQLETTLASIGDAVIATDEKGQITFMNHVAESLTGWRRDEAVGRSLETVFRIVNEQTRQPVDNPALRTIREGRVVGLANHTILIAKSGAEIPIDDSGSPIQDSEGNSFGAVLIFRDITERRRSERERELLAQQARVLNSGFDAIIVRDLNDRIVSWNRAAEDLYGWTAEEAAGRDVHALLKTEFSKPLDEISSELHRNGRWEGELIHTCKDGRSRTVLSHWVVERDGQGQPRSILQINIDISRRKQAEAALQDQRELLRVTLSSIGDGVIATDTKGAVTFLNHVAETLTGWTAEAAIGRPLQDIFHIVSEQTRLPVENPALRAIHEGIILGLANHTILISKDGTERPIDDAGSPIRDAEGKTIGAVLTFRDVADRRRLERAQAELLENERTARLQAEAAELRLQLALDAGHMGTWQYDIRTREVIWSPGLEQIHGYESGTFPRSIDAFQDEIHPADRQAVLDAIGAAIERGQDHHIEYRIVRKDGSVRWIEGGGRLFFDNQGYPDRMVAVCTDITERKQAAEAENRARRAAEEANRAKDEFLALLSHELRNPLSSILGWAVLLRTGELPLERARHALEVIERNTRVEAQLVESLLDLSRIAAGKLKLDAERIDLSSVLDFVVASLRPSADDKGISVDLEVPPAPVVVIGDSGRLQQVFSNLLTNALKFTPRGGQIQVRIGRDGSHAKIQVIDDGEGMDSAFLPHVFDRFRQAEGATTRTRGGLGLGLAIVRELVEAHRGNVVAESRGKGLGSTFTVTLPIPAVIPSHIEASSVPSEEAGKEPSISGVRVLVVDDDADARELVALALKSKGATVEMAASASEAIDSVDRLNPEVMIADIGLPHEDGYALIQKLRALEREQSRNRLSAIALTAYASATDRDQALAAGYDFHLTKPVGFSHLIDAVARFSDKR